MFWKVWLIVAGLLVLGWIAYAIWRAIDLQREKKRPKPKPKHLQEVKKSFEEYTKKMEQYKKPTHKREQ
jgi:type VI protein secretion system component VasK